MKRFVTSSLQTIFPYAERCMVHFERGNWVLFDKESPSASDTKPTVNSRLVDLYNFFTAGFSKFSLNTRGQYDRVLQRLALAKTIEPGVFLTLAVYALRSGRISRLWQEIGALRKAFVAAYPSLQPLVQMHYWHPESQDLAKFKLSDKRFDHLRQLYIDCFETLYRLLTIAVGVEAIIYHKELAIPTKKRKMVLDEFAELPNAAKLPHIAHYPIQDLFLPVLDSDFRNSIGHHAAHYDAASDSVVVYHSKKSGNVPQTVPYTEFCERVLRLFAAFELAAMYHHDVHLAVNGQFILPPAVTKKSKKS